jgi:hypothetical protein
VNFEKRLQALERQIAYAAIQAPAEDPRKLVFERIAQIAQRAEASPEAVPIEVTFQQFDDRIREWLEKSGGLFGTN